MKHKKIFLLVLVLIILSGMIIFYFLQNKQKTEETCRLDSDCVPATCCHATSCVLQENAPECAEILCSMECAGPLDCNEGHCGCVDKKCQVIPR